MFSIKSILYRIVLIHDHEDMIQGIEGSVEVVKRNDSESLIV